MQVASNSRILLRAALVWLLSAVIAWLLDFRFLQAALIGVIFSWLDSLGVQIERQRSVLFYVSKVVDEFTASVPDGQFVLGVLHREGRVSEQPWAERSLERNAEILRAKDLYTRAATAGHVKAQVNLGAMYCDEATGLRDLHQAEKWFRKAGETGDAIAQCNLGIVLLESRRPEEAVECFRRAADQGNGQAQFQLAKLYIAGNGIGEDRARGLQWLHMSGRGGERDARHLLGWLYAHGEGVERDQKEALRWFLPMAQSGDREAMYQLGLCCERLGSIEEAKDWYRKAGTRMASDRITLLEAEAAGGDIDFRGMLIAIHAAQCPEEAGAYLNEAFARATAALEHGQPEAAAAIRDEILMQLHCLNQQAITSTSPTEQAPSAVTGQPK